VSAVAVVTGDLADRAWRSLPSGPFDQLEPCSPTLTGGGGCGAVGGFVAAFARAISGGIRVHPAQVTVVALAPVSADSNGRWVHFSVLVPTPAGVSGIERALHAAALMSHDWPSDDALRISGVSAVSTECAPFFEDLPCASSTDCGGCARACWQGRCTRAAAIDVQEVVGARAVARAGTCKSAALSACDATCAVCNDGDQ
jgi:hypothetical protein